MQGVDCTYASMDGYCPLAAFLGSHGICFGLAQHMSLRHTIIQTNSDLERVITVG